MKKVLSWVLALALVLGTFATSFAADSDALTKYSDLAGKKSEGAVAVLSALDVVTGYPDGTYKAENVVTRAEMAALIIRALDLSKYAQGTESKYSDVPTTHWAAAEITYATSMGIIEGYPDGTFKPSATVTYQEALTMLVRALGYQDEYLNGSWPANFVNQARTLNLLDDIDTIVGGANRGDVAIMLYNALDRNLVTYDKDGNQTDLKVDSTMLERLGGEKRDGFVIDETDVYDAIINIDEYLGAYVNAWFIDADDDGDVDELAAIEEVYSTFLKGDYNKTKGQLEVGDKNYELKTSTNSKLAWDNLVYKNEAGDKNVDADTFINGEVKALTLADDETYTLAVKISGSYITDVFSAQQWNVSEEYQWDKDLADDVKDDQVIDSYDFDLDDNDAIDTKAFTLVGVDSVDKIADDAVVTVYAKDNKKINKVEVSTETVKGKITKVNSDEDEFTIGGKAYGISDGLGTKLALGDEGVFYLNYSGDIAFFDADDFAGNYAILMDAPEKDSSYGSKDVWQQYMMNKEGGQVVYNFDDRDDGLAWSNDAAAVKGALVEFDTNSANKLTDIDPVTTKAAKSLTDKGVMNGKVISDDVVIFLAYEADVEDWELGALADLATGSDFVDDGSVVFATNDDGEIDVIVVTSDVNTTTTDSIGFVSAWNSAYDANDDKIFEGKVLVAGAEKDFVTDDNSFTTSVLGAAQQLYVIKYSDSKVTDFVAATGEKKTDAVSDLGKLDFVTYDANGTIGAITGLKATLAFGEFAKVIDVSGNTVNVGTDADSDFQYIGGCYAYEIAFDDNGAFDSIKAGSLSKALKKGAYVMFLQTDDEDSAWDTVIYVTKADAEDYVK